MAQSLRALLPFGSVVLAATLTFGCSAPAPDELGYEEELKRARAEKDTFLLTDSESPVPVEKRATLLPLSYYALDMAFRVPATLEVVDEPEVIGMPTPTGRRIMLTVKLTSPGQNEAS